MGVFLDQPSHDKLLEMFETEIPEGWKPIAHHITLAFNNGSEIARDTYEYYQPRFGETVELTITHVGMSEKALAVRVNWGDRIVNKLPHITVAISPIGKAVDSNFITDWESLPIPVTLKGTIGDFRR